MAEINLTGTAVSHRAFGRGTVKEVAGAYITIDFSGEERVFSYPDAFRTFLKTESEEAGARVAADLSAFDAAEQRKVDHAEYQSELKKARELAKRPAKKPSTAKKPKA